MRSLTELLPETERAPNGADTDDGQATDADVKAGTPTLERVVEGLDAAEAADDTSGSGGDAQDKTTLSRFNDLAEAVGVDLDTLYQLSVTTNDGEAVSVEALKARYGESKALELERLEWGEERARQESELRKAKHELTDLIAVLPEGKLNRDALEQVRERQQAQVAAERQRTLDVIPEWRDDAKREAELAGMAKHLASYGLPVDYLASVADHRVLNFVRDAWQREQRIQAALSRVRAGKPEPEPAVRTAARAPRKAPARPTRHTGNALKALFENLE